MSSRGHVHEEAAAATLVPRFPSNSHGALDASDLEGTSLAALADFAPKLLMPRGVRGMNEWSFEREFGQETDPHEQVMASCLTAAPVNQTSTGQTIGGSFHSDYANPVPERLPQARPLGGAATPNNRGDTVRELFPGAGHRARDPGELQFTDRSAFALAIDDGSGGDERAV